MGKRVHVAPDDGDTTTTDDRWLRKVIRHCILTGTWRTWAISLLDNAEYRIYRRVHFILALTRRRYLNYISRCWRCHAIFLPSKYIYRAANIVIMRHRCVGRAETCARRWTATRYQKQRALLPLITRHAGKTYVVYVTMKRHVISDRVRAQMLRA